jgi:hypothetical protein
MARIFTTPDAEHNAKVFMHDITVAGGINTKNLRTNTPYSFGRSDYCTAAQKICDELVNRDFNNIDREINRVTNFYFRPNFDGSGKNKSIKPEFAAKAIVYFAELLGLYWDDTIRTPYEIDEFKKTTLGEAVYKYGRYISAVPDKPSKSRGKAAAGPSVANATGGTGVVQAQQPKNGYKQSGPQSGNVRDLRDITGIGAGTPGAKVYIEGTYSYKIIGDNPQSKNTPNVFIRPLSASGAEGTTNKVFFNSGNGYTDCTCYFEDPNEAQAFLDEIIKNNKVPVNVSNPRIVKNKADANGYFLVGTEFGVVAISAKTLNEALNEEMTEKIDREVNWDKATEGYTKEELDELHTWMRRG